jgi:hypothetical protein
MFVLVVVWLLKGGKCFSTVTVSPSGGVFWIVNIHRVIMRNCLVPMAFVAFSLLNEGLGML